MDFTLRLFSIAAVSFAISLVILFILLIQVIGKNYIHLDKKTRQKFPFKWRNWLIGWLIIFLVLFVISLFYTPQ